MQDLIAGQIDMTISNTATAMPPMYARAGQGVCGHHPRPHRDRARNPVGGGSGVFRLQFSLWAGLFAPKGTPRDIIDKLNAAAVGTTHDPAMHQKLVDQGFVIPLRERQTPEALAPTRSRDRQMVADHQGGWHQGGMIQRVHSITSVTRTCEYFADEVIE